MIPSGNHGGKCGAAIVSKKMFLFPLEQVVLPGEAAGPIARKGEPAIVQCHS
jgi:hypothetical protein